MQKSAHCFQRAYQRVLLLGSLAPSGRFGPRYFNSPPIMVGSHSDQLQCLRRVQGYAIAPWVAQIVRTIAKDRPTAANLLP